MNPKAEFEKLYEGTDFTVYFLWLEACLRTEQSDDTQEHHICPRAQFPELEHVPENVMTLSIDDHVRAHRLLAALHPDFKRKAPDEWVKAAAEAGRKYGALGGQKHVESGHIARLIKAHNSNAAHQAAAARSALHNRWHVKRSVVNPACSLCIATI